MLSGIEMQRTLSVCDKERLKELNKAVSSAIAIRREWLDSKMPEYADMQIGETIYDLELCVPVGEVSKLYRVWQDRDEGVRDTSLSIEYEFETSPRCFDNTSLQPFKLGSKSQAAARARALLEGVS